MPPAAFSLIDPVVQAERLLHALLGHCAHGAAPCRSRCQKGEEASPGSSGRRAASACMRKEVPVRRCRAMQRAFLCRGPRLGRKRGRAEPVQRWPPNRGLVSHGAARGSPCTQKMKKRGAPAPETRPRRRRTREVRARRRRQERQMRGSAASFDGSCCRGVRQVISVVYAIGV